MLTYELKKSPGVPLYEALYRCIRSDILSGALKPGEKLPSKRALSSHLEVSKITVETAYNQLLAEGYICSREKVGYFVEAVERPVPRETVTQAETTENPPTPVLDLTGTGTEHFPFSVWSRLQREVMLDYGEKLLQPMPHQGIRELRQAIQNSHDPEEIWHLTRRIAELTPMLTQMNELAELTAHYYERGYWRSEKYTV